MLLDKPKLWLNMGAVDVAEDGSVKNIGEPWTDVEPDRLKGGDNFHV